MLAGVALRGGRVLADWPGLSRMDLVDGRDLRPTGSLNALITSLCADTFALDDRLVASTLFPHDPAPGRIDGLIRS